MPTKYCKLMDKVLRFEFDQFLELLQQLFFPLHDNKTRTFDLPNSLQVLTRNIFI